LNRSRLIFMICFILIVAALGSLYVYNPGGIVDIASEKIVNLLQARQKVESGEQAEPDKEAGDEKEAESSEESQEQKPDEKPGEQQGESKTDEKTDEKAEGTEDAEAAEEAEKPEENADPNEAINLNNVEMKVIIQKLGEWTGKPIIPTTDDVMKQKITIFSPVEVRRSVALSLIYDALRTKGFIAEENEDKIFLKPIAQARLGSVPTLGVDEPLARLVDKSQIVEKFFQLENYSPLRLEEIITPLTAEYGHVTAIESTGNVAVIDTVANLMRIERIIKQLDVPESEQQVEQIFEIKKGDPGIIVQVLQSLLDTRNRGKSPQKSAPSANKNVKPATSVVIESSKVPVKLITIPKQNWIIASASADDMKKIAEWIEKLDKEEAIKPEQTIVQVRYADVREVANMVNRTIREMPGTEL